MSATYCIEPAKSNRSACKSCSIKIDKGQLRVGTSVPGPGDYEITSWRHLACQKRLPQLSGPSELKGFSELDASQKEIVFAWFEGDMETVKAQKRKADEAAAEAGVVNAFSTPKKSKKQLSAPINTPTKQMASSAGSSSAAMSLTTEMARRDGAFRLFGGMTMQSLKNCLRENGALMSGNKMELVERCVDRKMYGNLPRCPQCGIGRLKVVYACALGHQGQGDFSCPGGYDDDAYVRCGYRAKSVERPPWIVTASEAAPPADGRKSSVAAGYKAVD